LSADTRRRGAVLVVKRSESFRIVRLLMIRDSVELVCSWCQRGSVDSNLGGSCRRDGAASLCGSKRRGAEVVPARLGKSTSDLLMCERPSRGSASMIVSPSRPTPAGVRDRWLGGVVVVPRICAGT
jgi:hypothetical protein